MYHKDMPFLKGLWIWDVRQCLGGDIDAVVRKCKDYDISYVIYKGGDGEFTYPTPKDGVSRPPQLTTDVVTRFHSAGIKIYSWTYNYGLNPLAEAAVAIKCLDLGVDGHVFDAKSEYEHLVNNANAAETMLQMVRSRHPDAFLAYSTYPIIDYHKDFPYLTFGKYCDAVMPQVYYGDWKRTPQAESCGCMITSCAGNRTGLTTVMARASNQSFQLAKLSIIVTLGFSMLRSLRISTPSSIR